MAKPLSKEQAAKLDSLLNLEDRGVLSCDRELIRLKSIALGYCAACSGLGVQVAFEGRHFVTGKARMMRRPCEYCK